MKQILLICSHRSASRATPPRELPHVKPWLQSNIWTCRLAVVRIAGLPTVTPVSGGPSSEASIILFSGLPLTSSQNDPVTLWVFKFTSIVRVHIWAFFSDWTLINVPDNASVTLNDVTIRPSPSLWLAIFDPVFDLKQALDSGYLSLNPINANGMSSINLDLSLIQLLNRTQMYYYST